jgi:NCAIR mutase (PurE)-related protein
MHDMIGFCRIFNTMVHTMVDLPVACAPTNATVYGNGNDGGAWIYRSGFAMK